MLLCNTLFCFSIHLVAFQHIFNTIFTNTYTHTFIISNTLYYFQHTLLPCDTPFNTLFANFPTIQPAALLFSILLNSLFILFLLHTFSCFSTHIVITFQDTFLLFNILCYFSTHVHRTFFTFQPAFTIIYKLSYFSTHFANLQHTFNTLFK